MPSPKAGHAPLDSPPPPPSSSSSTKSATPSSAAPTPAPASPSTTRPPLTKRASSTDKDKPRPRLPGRASSRSTKLPQDLERFLALYPHPAFALRASALYDALVGRKEPHAPRPVDLAGAGAGAVPSYGPAASSAAKVRGAAAPVTGTATSASTRRSGKPQLSSREQYEGGVEPDSTPSPTSDNQDESDPPASTRASSLEVPPRPAEPNGGDAAATPPTAVSGESGEADASPSSGAETDSSSLGPSASQVGSPLVRSPGPSSCVPLSSSSSLPSPARSPRSRD